MNDKTKRRLGFSMNEQNDNTILIEGVVQGNVSQRARAKQEQNFSKISLHLFDKEYIEKLQKVEVKVVNNDRSFREKFALSANKVVALLLK